MTKKTSTATTAANKARMQKQPKDSLILEFSKAKVDFSEIKHSHLLEKLFRSRPVGYLATMLYLELFGIAYDNWTQKGNESLAFLISYKELKEKLQPHRYETCTISNGLRSLHEAKLIIKDRVMIDNKVSAKPKRYFTLSITIKLPSSLLKELHGLMQTKAPKHQQ